MCFDWVSVIRSSNEWILCPEIPYETKWYIYFLIRILKEERQMMVSVPVPSWVLLP